MMTDQETKEVRLTLKKNKCGTWTAVEMIHNPESGPSSKELARLLRSLAMALELGDD